jgi:hypothetical protein
MSKELAKRKRLRLKEYDYSSAGAYFITIRLKEGITALSSVIINAGDGALDGPFDKREDTFVGDVAFDVPKITQSFIQRNKKEREYTSRSFALYSSHYLKFLCSFHAKNFIRVQI